MAIASVCQKEGCRTAPFFLPAGDIVVAKIHYSDFYVDTVSGPIWRVGE